ncbi:hypothetical protein CEXT_309141 [Caerostris extrusa]|uniref:Uncharacterized protein n=1 Tax=Caerostris extrusa TaxID=172846 RepID=A0AAV4Q8U0_CAEEX|nr:hypothetical protein CEXT_309141 [Caerostris extrusa]
MLDGRISCTYIAGDSVYVYVRGVLYGEVVFLPPGRRIVGVRRYAVCVELDRHLEGVEMGGGAMVLGHSFRGRRLQGKGGGANRVTTPGKKYNENIIL